MTNIVNIGPKGSKLDWDNWGKPITDAVNTLYTAQNRVPQSNGSTSSSSSVGATPTGVLTIPSCVFEAGGAYSVENIAGVLGSTTLEADFSLWKTSTSGTQIGAFYRTPTVGGGAIRNCYGKIIVRNTGATDLTFDLVLAVAASTGTCTHEAAANRPRQLIVTYIGPASSYGSAFVIT